MNRLDLDPDLVARARAGDDAALGQLLAEVEPMIYRFGVKLCGDSEDARGVLQETMITLVQSLGDLRSEAALTSWLYAVARSHCLKKRRTSKYAPARIESIEGSPAAGDVAADQMMPDEALDRERAMRALEVAIAGLDDAQREVLILRDVEGLPAKQVAEILELTVAATKSRLHRARQALRERVAELLSEPARPASGCPDVVEMLSRELEDELSPAVCEELDAHVKSCPACSARCDSLRQTLDLCCAYKDAELPENIRKDIAAAIRAATGRSP